MLELHGRSLDGHDDAPSVLADEEPALASLYDASAADLARLVDLVPPPRFHMLRYHGVLAAHAKARAEVVPGRAASTPSEPVQLGGAVCLY